MNVTLRPSGVQPTASAGAPSQVRRVGSEELAFASAVADLGALAIENAKLHEALKERLQALKADSNGWFRFLAYS